MSEEEKILKDFVDNENCEYVYDWQGFDWETICGAVNKILKENKELKEKIDKAVEYIKECTSSPDYYENFITSGETIILLKILEGDK